MSIPVRAAVNQVSMREDRASRMQEAQMYNMEHDEHARAVPPSTVAPGSYVSNTPPQQGSTQPGDGSKVRYMPADRTKGLSGVWNAEIPFKERAVGGAQKVRGTLLRKPDLKEHGQAILDGRTTHAEDKVKKD